MAWGSGKTIALLLIVALFATVTFVYGDTSTNQTTTENTTAKKVLFDRTKNEQAGNADWVIDGAYSNFANALRSNGFIVEEIRSGPIDSSKLQGYSVYVIPEAQRPFTTSESSAIKQFVTEGGGLFLIADHGNSDRDNDGWDSPHIYNEKLSSQTNYGIKFNYDTKTKAPITSLASTEINAGVTSIGVWAACTLTLSNGASGQAWQSGQTGCFVATNTVGCGRVGAIGDSSPFDDGTKAGGSTSGLTNNYKMYSIQKFSINMIKWLAGGSSGGATDTTPPTIGNIRVTSITATGATLSWNTSELATSVLYYGTSTSYGMTKSETESSKTHAMVLSGLTSGKTYYFKITCTDPSGNSASASNMNFDTLPNYSWLELGVSATKSISSGASQNYAVNTTSGLGKLTVTLTSSSTANINLYLKYGSQPTTSSYTNNSALAGPNEVCNITAQDGKLFILVKSSTGSCSYSILCKQAVEDTDNTNDTDPIEPSGTHMLISEVFYDTPGDDNIEEFVELYNPTGSAVSLAGWTLTDNGATFALSGTVPAGARFVVARNANGFYALFNKQPDLAGMTCALGNSGDKLTLKDSSGTIVDFVSYESYTAGWAVSASTGQSLLRNGSTDTDTASDWSAGTPSPGY